MAPTIAMAFFDIFSGIFATSKLVNRIYRFCI